MRTTSIHGIILKQKVLFEKDKILTIFTQEAGKISAFMKGARKITSRRNMHAELFNMCRFQIYTTTSGNMLINECTALETFPFLRQDFFRLCAASYVAEITDRLTAEENPSEKKCILLGTTLKMLADPKSNTLLILAAFTLKILTLLGNLPNFRETASHREKLFALLQNTPLAKLNSYEYVPQETQLLFRETNSILRRHLSQELVSEKYLYSATIFLISKIPSTYKGNR
ncbi:DNA repair protein RecO [Candidatus Peregrinibacteria bacterium]|nr:DNA repair protein RecO [Candidatus Peregrinibacteria bacterium]